MAKYRILFSINNLVTIYRCTLDSLHSRLRAALFPLLSFSVSLNPSKTNIHIVYKSPTLCGIIITLKVSILIIKIIINNYCCCGHMLCFCANFKQENNDCLSAKPQTVLYLNISQSPPGNHH